MTLSAFTKFDPRAFLENERLRVAAAKVAKPAKGWRGARFSNSVPYCLGHARIAYRPVPSGLNQAISRL
jgi:hypothetical protein